MMRRVTWGIVASAVGFTTSVLSPASAAAPKNVVVSAPAGAVARITVKSFVPMALGQSSIEILGASAGDLAGAALVGREGWAVHVSTLNTGCLFAGNCQQIPTGNTWGTQSSGNVRGLRAGTYDFVVLGRPGAKVSLRLHRALADQRLRFSKSSRQQVTELDQLYPSTSDQMPEAYFDRQLAGPPGRNVTVLVAHLQAGRPKTLQYSSCVRSGVVPAVHIPRYGSACQSDSEDMGGSVGAVSVGGQDCDAIPSPVCIPLTTDAFHLSVAYAQIFGALPHVSLTADILAAKSNVKVSAVTFTLP